MGQNRGRWIAILGAGRYTLASSIGLSPSRLRKKKFSGLLTLLGSAQAGGGHWLPGLRPGAGWGVGEMGRAGRQAGLGLAGPLGRGQPTSGDAGERELVPPDE